MLFKKFKILIFKENKGTCSTISIPYWVFLLTALVFTGLVGANIYFWDYYNGFKAKNQQLELAQKKNQAQSIQLASFYYKIKEIEKDLQRIREFDDRLKVMLNLEPESQVSYHPLGGSTESQASSLYPFYRQEHLARRMHSFIEELSETAKIEEIRQQEIIQAIQNQNDLLSSTPAIWPTHGWVSSEFGYRISPFTGRREHHSGLDISAPIGTPIYAPADGTVTFAGRDGAYGKSLVINHGRGVTTRYAHMHKFLAEINQKVTRGELIGYVGNTGRSTGPHLHYEVHLNNVPVNPMRYILN